MGLILSKGVYYPPNFYVLYIYIDNLLVKLGESGCGCPIRHIFMGALYFADGITLLSRSLRGLNEMLHISSIYADKLDITFNSKKKNDL